MAVERLLVADIGNSSTHVGVFDGDRLAHDWRASSALSRTADELHQLLRGFLGEAGLGAGDFTAGVLCSVVPTLTQAFAAALNSIVGAATEVVDHTTDIGVANLYAEPAAVGPDRLVNAAAAIDLYGAPAIVVDLGTATTFDVISKDGAYLGGAIAPGLRTSADVLFQRASRLPRVELVVPPAVIGRSTTESIQAGIVRGAALMVDAFVDAIDAELGSAATVIATGGDAPLMSDLSRRIEIIDPTLTLKGLRLVHARRLRR